ncbi:MurR/RpiR family transcriptional regulator [Lactococcus lactis]|uniref:MurR/RpiR family transcriptional regulator n=1 Tax=Lactococcus lactis TaxID=1358 RepID=UPI000C9F0FDE|nr:MurR/RpiR family transcriptional regulator [Lactococcus lactis]AUS68798.1 MurR/RpiR family transcriptional regulator [Lactococcus lactis subsp. lactis]
MSIFGKLDFTSLTPTEKAIYNYLQDHIKEIPSSSIRQISAGSYAGTASVMRLIHKMNYKSFNDFKNFVKQTQKDNEPSSDFFNSLSIDIYPSNLLQKLEALTEMILHSENILFFGVGASGATATLATRYLANLGVPGVFSLQDASWPIAKQLQNVADTLVIILSVSGETSEVLEAMAGMRKNADTKIAVITANPSSEAALLSDLFISYQINEWHVNFSYDMTSQIPAMFISEKLAKAVYKRLKELIK